MKKGKKIALVAFSAISVGAAALVLSSTGTAFKGLIRAEEIPNMLTLDKMSTRDTAKSKVTATTAKGNSVQFSYNRFDTRPGDTSYNNCMCFYAVNNGVGGYIKNDTALYGVKTVRIYGYSASNPTPDTYTTAEFNIYYGYESIDVTEANTARVNTTSGTYTFEDGLEPSYIAIETRTAYDLCISKVEILYKCEPVAGATETKTGPAYQYDYVGKEFTTASGKKVPYNITEQAPWVHVDSYTGASVNTNASWDDSTKTWTTTADSDLLIRPVVGDFFQEAAARKLVSVTFTPTLTGSGWGGSFDIYFGVNWGRSDATYCRVLSSNVLTTTQGWESYAKVVSIVDAETGDDMTGKAVKDKKVIATIDATGVDKLYNIRFGTSVATVGIAIEDITLKATACGHKAYEDVNSETAYQYQGAGTYKACPDCGDVLTTSGTVTTAAPWLRLKSAMPDDCTLTKNADGTYTSSAAGWKNYITYNFPSDLEGRTELALTIQTANTWDLYIYVGSESGTQFVTASAKINWGENALLTKVLDADGNSLNYNAETFKVGSAVGASKFTMIFDLTKAANDIAGKTLKVVLYAAGTHFASADLRTPCNHTTTEEFSNGAQCGTRCTSCGYNVSKFVDKTEISCPSGHDDVFSYETGVTFDGRKDCLKSRITAYTNNSDMGWAINYKVYYRNLVKNARAAGKTLISFNIYVKADRNDNIRLGWGVGNNVSAAQADHWNGANTLLHGSSIVIDNSTLTDESGTTAKMPANQWRILTIDVSGDDFASTDDFFLVGNFDSSSAKDGYPIETYVSNVRCAAPTVSD